MYSYGETSLWDRTRDILRWHGVEIAIVTAIIATIVVFGYGFVGAAREREKARKAFMAECVKDHKEYECTAMWRAGEPKTVVVPIHTTTVR